jgi:hypothetical protein
MVDKLRGSNHPPMAQIRLTKTQRMISREEARRQGLDYINSEAGAAMVEALGVCRWALAGRATRALTRFAFDLGKRKAT